MTVKNEDKLNEFFNSNEYIQYEEFADMFYTTEEEFDDYIDAGEEVGLFETAGMIDMDEEGKPKLGVVVRVRPYNEWLDWANDNDLDLNNPEVIEKYGKVMEGKYV